MRNMRGGSILVIALWSLCLLTTFTVYLSYGVRQKIIMVGRLDARDRLHFIAEAGVRKAILELKKKDAASGFAVLTEPWSKNTDSFKEIQVGRGTVTVSYDYLNRETGIREVRYGIMDEERKININKAKQAVLERLFQNVAQLDAMEAQELSASIVDWRDSDSELSVPLGSAEDRYYRNLKEPYQAKDADFQVPEELFLVKGMSREIFDKIKDFITVYGQGKININTASGEVLVSLGLYESVVDKILSFRNGHDSIEATADDNLFELPANIAARLSQSYSLSAAEVANLSNLISAGNFVTNSSNFMIKSVAKLDNKDASLRIACVFERFPEGSQESGKIKYWKEELN